MAARPGRRRPGPAPGALLPALVGRDPAGLDEKEIARAVVESVAENTVDAVVAPALWAAGRAARPGALGYRAVNTLDAMVGHRSPRYERYGWASARADDVAGWVPARLTAAPGRRGPARGGRGAVWRAVRARGAGPPVAERRAWPRPPSPPPSVSAWAASNRYGDAVELRPPLGTGPAARAAATSAGPSGSAGDVGLALAVAGCAAGRRLAWPPTVGPAAAAPGSARRSRPARTAATAPGWPPALGLDPAAVLDLSASLNPVAPDPAPGRRPPPRRPAAGTPTRRAATAALAGAIGVDPARLLLTNGGAEAIALVAAELGPGWVDEPDFSLYRRHLPALDPAGPRWRSNPHNPTGPAGRRRRDGPAVWDEAFWPLATGTLDPRRRRRGAGRARLADQAAGLPRPAARLRPRPPDDGPGRAAGAGASRSGSVNGLAAAALPDLLAAVDLPGWAAAVGRPAGRAGRRARAAPGLDPQPSDANWVLVDAAGLRDRLAARAILVRDCASFGLPGTVRIAVPDDDGLAGWRRPGGARRDGGGAHGLRHDQRRRQEPRSSPGCAGCWPGGACGWRRSRPRTWRSTPSSPRRATRSAGPRASRPWPPGSTPEVAMNPILLKPTGERTSQVVVHGPALGAPRRRRLPARPSRRCSASSLDALADLRGRFDVVVCEGAGSPAEINLLDHDIVNLRVAAATPACRPSWSATSTGAACSPPCTAPSPCCPTTCGRWSGVRHQQVPGRPGPPRRRARPSSSAAAACPTLGVLP